MGGPGVTDLGEAAEPVLTLAATRVTAEPGGQVQVPVRVENPGKVVESYRVDVVGLDAPWWQVLPDELSVYPGQEATATVVLSPPKGTAAPDAPLPFGVRVVSLVDPNRSVVEEGDLEVGRVLELQSRITPVTARARWSATFRLTFTNWGNAPVRLVLKASDPDEQLGFAFSQDAVVVPVGGAVTVRLKVRPRKPFLRGSPVRLPFTVTGEQPGAAPPAAAPVNPFAPQDPGRPVLEAAVEQRPVLTRGVVAAAAVALVLVAAAAALLPRLPDVPGARIPDAAPAAVTNVKATAVSADHVEVAWDAVDRATGYEVAQVDPRSGRRAQGVAVAGDVTVQDMAVDPAVAGGGGQGTPQVCYVVLAVRGAVRSTASPQECAQLLDASLPSPTGVDAAPNPDGTLDVSWDPQPQYDHRVLVDGAVQNDVVPKPGSRLQTGVVKPSGNNTCVQVTVLAVDKDQVSSEKAEGASKCVTPAAPAGTPPGGGSQTGGSPTTSAPTTSPTDGTTGPTTGTRPPLSAWVAQLGPEFQEQALATTAQRTAVAAGLDPARLVVATPADLPAQRFASSTTLVLVYTGFQDETGVQQFCAQQPQSGLGCKALQTGQP